MSLSGQELTPSPQEFDPDGNLRARSDTAAVPEVFVARADADSPREQRFREQRAVLEQHTKGQVEEIAKYGAG